MKHLYEALREYHKSDYYPMHMPGHKRNTRSFQMGNPYEIDITEVEGFDNLGDAKGILKECMERASNLYQTQETLFLVNGSTVGLLTAISASVKQGERILVARNCHKAVYNAIFINQLNPVYLYPQIEYEFGINGGISVKQVTEMLIKYPDIKAVVITSPTYEGILSDVEGIASVVHKHGILLIVDEAHGAHLGFHKELPNGSIQKGADLIVHSIHKTLPSFTQTALLHINSKIVDSNRIRDYLNIYQTSSPSYLLMSGIDRCIEVLEVKGEKLFEDYMNRLQLFYHNIKNLEKLKVLEKSIIQSSDHEIYDLDPSKIVISTKGTSYSGNDLYEELYSSYKIQVEMAATDYIIAMTSIGDTDEGFDRLEKALHQIDRKIEKLDTNKIQRRCIVLDMVFSPSEAYNREGEYVTLEEAEGCIAKEYVSVYPPGIPLIVPGEKITKESMELLKHYKKQKLEVKGLHMPEHIQVIKR